MRHCFVVRGFSLCLTILGLWLLSAAPRLAWAVTPSAPHNDTEHASADTAAEEAFDPSKVILHHIPTPTIGICTITPMLRVLFIRFRFLCRSFCGAMAPSMP